MIQPDQSEAWLRGPVKNIPPLLQPVAHALIQAREEVNRAMTEFPDTVLWEKPAGAASVGFHLQHLAGVLDRLFTYAKGNSLTPDQLRELQTEEIPPVNCTVNLLLNRFDVQVEKALKQLQETSEQTLLDPMGVGRKKLPSTVLGLLFHAAEHTQRHTGQLLVTARVLRLTPSH